MSRPAHVIGLGGALRSGKDTAADHLVQAYGYVKLGMSDVLAECMYTLNPYIPLTAEQARALGLSPMAVTERYQDIVDAHGYVEAKRIPEVRRLLQALGTEVGRNIIDPELWVKLTSERITAHLRSGTDVVVTGIRYPNELRMIERLQGRAVYIERPQDVNADHAAHSSETSVGRDDFDMFISNFGTIRNLHWAIESVHDTLTAQNGR